VDLGVAVLGLVHSKIKFIGMPQCLPAEAPAVVHTQWAAISGITFFGSKPEAKEVTDDDCPEEV